MTNLNSDNTPLEAAAGGPTAKNSILKELETLTNQGKFEELVNLYITTFMEVKPDPEYMRKIKKKVIKKLDTRKEAFQKADLSKIRMRVLDEQLEMQINMVQNELTRTIILLVSYMVKHGNDETTKEIFRWIKEQSHNKRQNLISILEKGVPVKES